MKTKTVDRLVFEALTKGYGEVILSLLKYRRLAQGLERLYGSQALGSILKDEERHARLFLQVASEMDLDVAGIGAKALLEEMESMADAESKTADEYEQIIDGGRITNERVLGCWAGWLRIRGRIIGC